MSQTYLGDGGNNSFVGQNGVNWLIFGFGGNDRLTGGNLADTIDGGTGADTINGGGGIDSASYSASSAGVTVNLGAGTGAGGDAAGDRLGSIENLIGSNFADVLIGDGVNRNGLSGGLGNDTLYAAGRDTDVMDGGAGVDTANFSLFNVGLTIELQAGTASDMSLIDPFVHFFSNVENAVGGSAADLIVGEYGANALDGGSGNDTLRGGTGADTLRGGVGVDTADFSMSEAAVTVNLTRGQGFGGEAQGDMLSGIEHLQGTEFGDLLVGDAGANSLFGVLGNDTLMASGTSSDTLNGGGGIDTASYALFGVGLTIDLAAGSANDASLIKPFVHFMTSIENAVGGSAGDLLVGNAGANVLDGGAGNDTLRGGVGADGLKGGAGVDTADYSTSKVGVTANLTTGLGNGGEAQGDTLSDIENLIGTEFGDRLIGNAASNSLNGVLGNDTLVASGTSSDTLNGGGGIDTADFSLFNVALTIDLAAGTASDNSLIKPFVHFMTGIENAVGGNGNDLVIGDNGANVLDGGAGNDTLRSGDGADVLRGGAGIDTVDYSTSTAAVTVHLFADTGAGGDAQGDTYDGIENAQGTEFGDRLVGDEGNNWLNGVLGDDNLRGGQGGDTLIGGGGFDTIDYLGSALGVTVNLAKGTAEGGDAKGDQISSIEGLVGSAQADFLTGDHGANLVAGRDGNDTITGGGGDDSLFGGAGNDRFVFADASGLDVISDFAVATETIAVQANINGGGVSTAEDVLELVSYGGGNAVIDWGGGNTVTIIGVAPDSLTAGNFVVF